MRRIGVGESVGLVTREMGVSRRTGFKWPKRFREEGEEGPKTGVRGPRCHSRRIPRQRRRRIERLRCERSVRAEGKWLGLSRLEMDLPRLVNRQQWWFPPFRPVTGGEERLLRRRA